MATSRCPQKPLTNHLDIMVKNILPYLMRQDVAKPFLRPVDSVAYGLPDYPKIIKSPIDLSTIKERIQRKFYSGFINCLQDFNLMLENCYIYNSPDDPIILIGIKLKQYFSLKLKLLPPTEFKLVKRLKHGIVPLKKPKICKNHLKRKNTTEAIFDKRRFLDKDCQNQVIYENKNSSSSQSMCGNDFEKCTILLNELMSSKYKSINHIFLKPVDTKSLRLTDYHEFVKYPIDLSTIKAYFDAKLYENKTTLINDIYLMLNNCILYNGVDTDIGLICRRFQLDFENLYLSLFKERCRENVNDEAVYILMKIKRRHKEIEEMIRINTENISAARQRIDMIVNMFDNNEMRLREERKQKMLVKFPQTYPSPKSSKIRLSDKKLKSTLKKNVFQHKSDVY